MGGGKNQVTLTFAGDSDQLERASARSQDALRKMEDQAKSSMGGINRVVGEGGRSFGQYGTGLGGLGDRADEADTRMMGLSDGIQGVSDLMRAEELRPHEFAMAFSDLGSSMYNTVIPSLQDLGGKVSNLGSRMKEGIANAGGFTSSLKKMAPAMLGVGAAAGVAVVGFQAWQQEQAKGRQQLEETRQALQDAEGDITRLDDAFITSRFEPWIEGLNDAGVSLATLRLALSGNEEAIREVEVASASMGHAAGSQLRNRLEEGIGALDRESAQLQENAEFAGVAGEAILTLGQRHEDAAGDIDRVSGAIDRLLGRFVSVEESIIRQNELVFGLDQHWQQMSTDFGGAAMSLDINTAAGGRNRQMLNDLISASLDTINVMHEQGSTSEQIRAQWERDRAELSAVIDRFRAAGGQVADYDAELAAVDRLVSTRVTQSGASSARSSIHLLGVEILNLPRSRNINIGLNILRATGVSGLFTRHHSGGTFHAPQGRNEGLAMLLDGERVTRPGQFGHDGGPNITVNVQGSIRSDRELVGMIRDELMRRGFGGVR